MQMMEKGKQIVEVSCDPEGCRLVDKNNKKQEDEGPEQAQDQEQVPHQIVAVDSQENAKSNSMQPVPGASCLDQGSDAMRVVASASAATSAASSSRPERNIKVETGNRSGRRNSPRRPKHWWGDCAPNVALLREALLSSAPDIAVLGPLHGCFAFYMSHLHNEVLSSTYARTMTLGPNVTTLESSFMWVGGWRPTSALVLVYSLMGIDIENALQAVSAGRDIADCSTSALLSPRQLSVMHTLQKHTQHAEMKISKKLTLLQMLIGDQDVLEAVLLDAASPVANDSSRFNVVADKRMSRFRRLLVQAEELRLHTLKDLLSLLTPVQAARCGVAVFEMCSSFRTMGTKLLPRLQTLATPSLPAVAIPPLPTPPSSSSVDSMLLVGGGFSGRSASDLSSSFFFPGAKCVQSGEFRFSHSIPDNERVRSSGTPFRQSNVSTNSSNILFTGSDETEILAPCSNSSSSNPLLQDSSPDLVNDERSRALATLDHQLLELALDEVSSDELVPTEVEQEREKAEEGELISNRLLLLSPANSDVAIQNCSLETADLNSYFEIPQPQLPPAAEDIGDDSNQGKQSSSGSADNEDTRLQSDSKLISILWIWSSTQSLKRSVHLKLAEWLNDCMDIFLWRRRNSFEVI